MNNQKINQTSDIVIEVIQIFGELDLSNILRELILKEDELRGDSQSIQTQN